MPFLALPGPAVISKRHEDRKKRVAQGILGSRHTLCRKHQMPQRFQDTLTVTGTHLATRSNPLV